MTHPASAVEPGRPANGDQLAAFRAVSAHFPDVPASIANSGGVFLPADFHADLARPGVALFGSIRGLMPKGYVPLSGPASAFSRPAPSRRGRGAGIDSVISPLRPHGFPPTALGMPEGGPRYLGCREATRPDAKHTNAI